MGEIASNNILMQAASHPKMLEVLLNAMIIENPEFFANAKALLQQLHHILKASSNPQTFKALLDALTKLALSPQEITPLFTQVIEGRTLINTVLNTKNPEVIRLLYDFINKIPDREVKSKIRNINALDTSALLNPLSSKNLGIVLDSLRHLEIAPEQIETILSYSSHMAAAKTPEDSSLILNFITTIPNQDIQARLLKNSTVQLCQKLLNHALTQYNNEFKVALQLIERLPKKAMVELYQNQTLVAFNNVVQDTENRVCLFKVQMQVCLAMVKEKINDLDLALEAKLLVSNLERSWNTYQANKDLNQTSQLQQEFAQALEKAKPVFIQTEQGTGFLNWLVRMYYYLFHYSGLTQKDEQSFRKVKQIEAELSQLNPLYPSDQEGVSTEATPGEEGMPQYPEDQPGAIVTPSAPQLEDLTPSAPMAKGGKNFKEQLQAMQQGTEGEDAESQPRAR